MTKTRKNNPENKRTRILKAARDLFVKQGYHPASMSQIARKSGVTQSMIHYYFESKQGLFQAVIAEALAPLYQERLIPKGSKRNLKELLRTAMVRRFHFFQKNPDVIKLLSRTLLMDEFQPSELGKKVGGRWIDIYRQAQQDGLIRSDIAPQYIMTIYLALTTYWFQDDVTRAMVRINPNKTREQVEDEFLEVVASMFIEWLHIKEPGENDHPGAAGSI